jgi:predicted metalloprotease
MKWNRRANTSRDVIDVRGGGGRRAGLPGGGGVRVGGGLGLVGVIVFLAIQLLGGGAAFDVPPGFSDGTSAPSGSPIPESQDPDADLKAFSGYVFNSAQDRWEQTFAREGSAYDRAQLVLYRSGVDTGCGSATSAVGPFYCPADQRVYLDLSFWNDMENQLRAPGDFAWAYVIAHEVGHHVQKLMGTSDQVRSLQRSDPDQANALSVRLELQADCYAGVWANGVFAQLDPGDLEEAMTAAQAVGDDRLQRQARGSVDPDSFTHGTSEQRARWFTRGREQGEPAACDTFSAGEV